MVIGHRANIGNSATTPEIHVELNQAPKQISNDHSEKPTTTLLSYKPNLWKSDNWTSSVPLLHLFDKRCTSLKTSTRKSDSFAELTIFERHKNQRRLTPPLQLTRIFYPDPANVLWGFAFRKCVRRTTGDSLIFPERLAPNSRRLVGGFSRVWGDPITLHTTSHYVRCLGAVACCLKLLPMRNKAYQ